jgi:CheY-like chemotaxis protein
MLLKNKQVFIVEDNSQNRVVFSVILQKSGAKVHFERWGEAALYQLKMLGHADVIILDLMLAEGVTGYDVFDAIRALPEYKNTPIVAVSATDPQIGIRETKARGFSGFISKPVDKNTFAQQIYHVICGEKVWDGTLQV